MKCASKDCGNEAECAIALNVPARGCPIAEHDPLRVVLGLALCAKCVAETKASDFLAAAAVLMKIFRVMAKGRAEPDFVRAFVSRVEFDSNEWRALTKKR